MENKALTVLGPNMVMVTLPLAEYYTDTRNHQEYSYDRTQFSNYITPYHNYREITETIHALGIKLPFENIVTRDQGLSECPYCKTKYQGAQLACSNKVTYYQPKGAYYRNKGELQVGDIDRENGCRIVESVKKDFCNSTPKWDLQEQFDLQKEYFDFVMFMAPIRNGRQQHIEKFKHLVSEDQLLQAQNLNLERQLLDFQYRAGEMFNQIAQKMNNAGHSLVWGG